MFFEIFDNPIHPVPFCKEDDCYDTDFDSLGYPPQLQSLIDDCDRYLELHSNIEKDFFADEQLPF